ncbi:MAG TPA: ferritin family protein [Candidatus Krumholzibacteriaceae bacterium]|nr:ferritin family protein [Candidatus Krumholzibacteriaceae bacterium]
MSSTQQLEKILRTAIEVEINGMATFSNLADKTENENGKKMFRQLEKDEIEHREILERQLEHLTENGEWKEIQIPQSKVASLIPKVREKQIKTKGKAKLGEIDALNTALDLESKAAEFFRQQADKVNDPRAREMFLRLAEWEDSHFDLIQAELDSLNNSGVWFGVPAFRMDGQY